MTPEQGRTPDLIRQDHREKMRDKRLHRDRIHRERAAYRPHIRANLSRRHPDFGMSPAQHQAAKERRNVR